MRQLTGDPILVDQLMANYRHARIDEREKRMLDFVVKVTIESQTCSEADLDVLRKDGWTDEDVMDIVQVAAMFNYTNRIANACGWVPNEEYHSFAR